MSATCPPTSTCTAPVCTLSIASCTLAYGLAYAVAAASGLTGVASIRWSSESRNDTVAAATRPSADTVGGRFLATAVTAAASSGGSRPAAFSSAVSGLAVSGSGADMTPGTLAMACITAATTAALSASARDWPGGAENTTDVVAAFWDPKRALRRSYASCESAFGIRKLSEIDFL